ncbi:MAG: DnaA regulatory inactivator Hda [Burkholderiaceae bacterium]
MKQIPLAIGTEAVQSFDSFLAGANVQAVVHLQALGTQSAPVYLWGGHGSGKTHLLRARVHQAQQQGARAGYFCPNDPPPWRFDAGWALVAIDDCDALDAAQQHAAFTLFLDAVAGAVPVLAAGSVPPVDLPLREDLRTRLGWGHVFALQPLAEPEVRGALRREADRRGVFLSDEVMDYLMTRFARDLSHLMARLDRLDEFSLATKRAITVPLLKQMLAEDQA